MTKKLRKSQDTSIFHDSRADVRSIMEVCNELTDKVNEIVEILNEQERKEEVVMKRSMIEIPVGGIGEVSDGYHTFNELYHHRAILFSVICNANKN